MPPKRNPKSKKRTVTAASVKKQKNTIDSRLLAISLKVDDYIYKDVPMSPRNAALFLSEVSGYKDKCVGDKRSLQVIEKLERCMKGIIEEQREPQDSTRYGGTSTGDHTDRPVNYNDSGNQRDIIEKPTTSNAIYTKHTENDLSWIENLRYVREISVEEITPVNYQDSFWESYSLPNDWNDSWFQSFD